MHPAIEIQAEHVLAPLSRARERAGAAVSGVLNSADYQLLMVEAPEVPRRSYAPRCDGSCATSSIFR